MPSSRMSCAPARTRTSTNCGGDIPDVGGTLIPAQFPRTYIDPNREPDDIDPRLLAGPWPGDDPSVGESRDRPWI